MRELKFRAWNKEKKKWLDPEELIVFGDGTFGEVDKTCWDGGVTTNLQEYWDNIIVMQYTGLKDKNEKEIYEGDIIIYRITRSPHGYEEHEDFKGIVKFKDGAFWTGFEIDHGNQWNQGPGSSLLKGAVSTFRPSEYSCEIIGNIYDNPGLL